MQTLCRQILPRRTLSAVAGRGHCVGSHREITLFNLPETIRGRTLPLSSGIGP